MFLIYVISDVNGVIKWGLYNYIFKLKIMN